MAITTNGKVSITNLQVGSSADLAGIISDESGTGVLAFTTSPTFTTPVLGAATATSVNKVTITAPATNATLTLAEGSTLTTSGAHATTITTTGTTAITLPTSGTLATTADVAAGQVGGVTETATQTLTNKTLTSPVLGGTTTTASGNLVVEPATYILEVKGGGATVGQIQLNCPVNSHGQKIASQPHAASATNTLTLPGGSTIGNDNAVLVSDTGTQTLTNKTLTAPKFASEGEIDDANGAELIKFPGTVADAVNEITITNAATGNGVTTGRPTISATGDDSNIALNLVSKGSGTVQANGVPIATTTGTQTLSNKTLDSAILTGTLTAGGGVGTNGQILKSTGTGVQWGAAAESLSPFNHSFMMMGA